MKPAAVMLATLSLAMTPVAGQQPVGLNSRAEAVNIIAGLREIGSPKRAGDVASER